MKKLAYEAHMINYIKRGLCILKRYISREVIVHRDQHYLIAVESYQILFSVKHDFNLAEVVPIDQLYLHVFYE